MWNSDTFGYNESTDPLYVSIPFFIGLRGGVSIEEMIEKMDRVAGDAQAELQTSIEITASIINIIKPHCAGVHLMMMGWETHVPAFLHASGIRN